MRIVADENIPLVHEFFSTLGEVHTLAGRGITAADVRDADILLVRSVTAVGPALLDGSRVGFVGTCTIGVDHLDLAYLRRNNIACASAPGCNANAVVEYVFSVLSALDIDWREKVFGIVGCGNVGGRLCQRLQSFGVTCRRYDPFLDLEEPVSSLDAVLAADIVSLHTPLTRGGAYPTHHMLGLAELLNLAPGAVLINTGRGAVIDNRALLRALRRRDDLRVALDVWEPEPGLDPLLLDRVTLGTPHIAGYSYDGKVAGTEMVYRALCRFLSREVRISARTVSEPVETAPLAVAGADAHTQIRAAVLRAYDVRVDDGQLRAAARRDHLALPEAFDAMRKHYPRRLEFSNYRVVAANGGTAHPWLRKLGFGL